MIYVREHVACQECEGGATISVDWQKLRKRGEVDDNRSFALVSGPGAVRWIRLYCRGGGGVARFAGYCGKNGQEAAAVADADDSQCTFRYRNGPYWGCCCCLVAGMGWDAGVVLREVCWD
jgi:hypothetical protein